MLWQIFFQKSSRMRYPVLLLHWWPLPYIYIYSFNTPFHMLNHMQIKVALDEVVSEGKEVTFKHDVYSDIYINILGLMAKCDMAPIHCAKTTALCMQWAKIRRYSVVIFIPPSSGLTIPLGMAALQVQRPVST